jgi:hypothetical protein
MSKLLRRYSPATMTEPATQPEARRSRAPVWLAEGLDIMEQRQGVMLGVTGMVIAVGIALTLLVPSLLPPVAVVGAAVAVAAMLLGLAAAVAVDTTDLTVRGPRHVSAAKGELVAVLPTHAQADAATELAAAVFEARAGEATAPGTRSCRARWEANR